MKRIFVQSESKQAAKCTDNDRVVTASLLQSIYVQKDLSLTNFTRPPPSFGCQDSPGFVSNVNCYLLDTRNAAPDKCKSVKM